MNFQLVAKAAFLIYFLLLLFKFFFLYSLLYLFQLPKMIFNKNINFFILVNKR